MTKAAEPEKPVETPKVEENGHLPRSVRRQLTRAQNDAAYERGRREALEEMVRNNYQTPPAKEAAAAADGEPDRKNFATDAEYTKALGAWSARQEA